MKIGLIDVDGRNFPNLPLMKISAWHKSRGDAVEWYMPLLSGHMDKVYISKVFSFTPDYQYPIDADEVIRAGSGYCIEVSDGKEIYHTEKDLLLPYEIEHIYPDYSLYPEFTKDTAYGFMTRGCPNGCEFCHVGCKEGRKSHKVADLSEFWHGQKYIELMDPNTLACPDWKDILQQLIDSKAYVNFNQGVDIRLMTKEKAEMIRKIKVKSIHFAWDRYEDKEIILPKLREFKEITGWGDSKMTVYVLVNFDTTIEQDLERIYTLRDMGYSPYVMIYNKEKTKSKDTVRKMQRWVNAKWAFKAVSRFEDYKSGGGKTCLEKILLQRVCSTRGRLRRNTKGILYCSGFREGKKYKRISNPYIVFSEKMNSKTM